MEHVPILSLVVITLLQLCRAQSSNSTPEWYAANDINDTNFSPKPITELFSTETSFSPEDPIIVLSPTSPLPSNRGIVSSPTPTAQYSDGPENQPPPSVIPLSSTELPPSLSETLPAFQTTPGDTQPPRVTLVTQEAPITESNPTLRTTQDRAVINQAPAQLPRGNIGQNAQQNQPLFVSNRNPPQQLPRNIQFLLPTQTGNRIFQGQQLPTNGQPNVYILYERLPPNVRNMAPANFPMPPQSPAIPPQPSMPLRDPQQQMPALPPNIPNVAMRQQPQVSNGFPTQPVPLPPFNMPASNIQSSQPNTAQRTGQTTLNPNNNQQGNNAANDQGPVNQMTSPPLPPNSTVTRRRPLQQRNRLNGARLNNRRPNRTQTANNTPCQRINNTATPTITAAKNQPNPVITIRLRPSTMSRNTMQIKSAPNSNTSTTVRPKPSSLVNNRNYDRCLNSCKDRKDRICAGPMSDVQINPDTLKGFPSMCHMACHNTFRANPIYGKIANGRCGKLRTRIQSIDKTKIRRDELKKSQYTIISNIPGTVVELAP